MACLWGWVGLTLGKELCDRSGRQTFFEEPLAGQTSWYTALWLTNKGYTPDDPCLPMHIYAASLHWSAMTVTSIGYGDIVPVRYEEYMVCFFCQVLGGLLWAYVIGSACSILCKGDPVEESFEEKTDLLNRIMSEARMPAGIRQVFREYLREVKRHESMRLFRQMSEGFSPLLQGGMLVHMSDKWIQNVYYFQDAPDSFVIELSKLLEGRFYARREPLNDVRYCLCVVDRGTIAHGGNIVTNGSAFHLDMIISNRALQDVRPTISLTYCQVLVLTRNCLETALDRAMASGHWRFVRKIRRCALKLALCRIVRLCGQRMRELQEQGHTQKDLSFAEMYDLLDIHMGGGGDTNSMALANVKYKRASQAVGRRQ